MRVAGDSGEAIGIFGGSFDPPHCGHVLLAAYALSAAPIDRLLIVPTFAHPFSKPLQPYEHRVRMCELAFGVLRGAEVSRIEEELGLPSFTVRTLETLAARAPGATLRLFVGADVIGDAPRWREWERVRALARPFVIGRSGYPRPESEEHADIDLPAFSSTEVRERMRDGRSVAGLVPRAVEEYAREHALYR